MSTDCLVPSEIAAAQFALYQVDNMAELEAIPIGPLTFTFSGVRKASVAGHYAAGDKGGGEFWFDVTSAVTAVPGMIITPTIAIGGGQWKRLYSGPVDARWVGVKGDGIANDYSRAQAAITYIEALAGGGSLLFPVGDYLLGTKLSIAATKSLHLFGEGWGHNNVGGVGGSRFITNFAGPAIEVGVSGSDRTCDVRLENFRIDGGLTGTKGVYIRQVHNMRLELLRIERCTDAGVDLDQAYSNVIDCCYINNNTGTGIRAGAYNDFTRITDCLILANTVVGIHFTNGFSSKSVIRDNDVEGNGVGIKLDAGSISQTQAFTLADNDFESQVGDNVQIGTDASAYFYDNPNIHGNNFNAGAVGHATNKLVIDRCRIPVITGNTFADCDVTFHATRTTVPTFLGNKKSGASVLPTSFVNGIILTNETGFLIRSGVAGEFLIATSVDWALSFGTLGLRRWRIDDSTSFGWIAENPSPLGNISGLSASTILSKNLCGTATFAGASPITVTLPNVEIDGSYRVFIQGSNGEDFYPSNFAAGSFKINSSNAASIATVTWLLVRLP